MHFVTLLWKNLSRRPVRSLLTALGISLAIATMMLLRGASMGFERSFLNSLERRGLDIVVVAAGVPDQLRGDLDEAIGPKMMEIRGVSAVYPAVIELIDVERGSSLLSVLVHGWPADSPSFDDLELRSGRILRSGNKRQAMLGYQLAKNLGKSVDDTVILQGEEYRVVGIYSSHDVFENGSVIMPMSELQRLMARPRSVTAFSVVVQDGYREEAEMDRIVAQIDSLKDERGQSYRITAEPARRYVSEVIQIRIAKGMAWFTSGIALVIGSVGMLNTMLMSVMERTREIGILRAMGWRRSRVVRMILGEAFFLSVAGAAIGIALALVALQVLSLIPQTSGFVSGQVAPRVLVEGILLTLLVVFLGGFYPAQRAARLLPTEALRYE